jgi:hypothetical protein
VCRCVHVLDMFQSLYFAFWLPKKLGLLNTVRGYSNERECGCGRGVGTAYDACNTSTFIFFFNYAMHGCSNVSDMCLTTFSTLHQSFDF